MKPPPADALPIDALRETFRAHAAVGPVVITSPTGSGKSTQVPRWCEGRVLVVEPRRLACRALAARVADLEGSPLGGAVGYSVRDEHRAAEATRILFVTPGVALRMFPEWGRFESVVLDEFHERSLDTDLLLALLLRRSRARLTVMSATLDGDRIAAHLGGRHLRADARTYPVTMKYVGDGAAQLPSPDGLEDRLRRALDQCRDDPGDVLVFLPGKGEIAEALRALRGRREVEVVPLHGELSLEEQRRAFAPTQRRKVVLATNVAETSVTIPGVGVVIDGGLARQTRYRGGRASLTLAPVAQDSADQRAGRAGRTAPGVCYRLWSAAARLAPVTLPAVHRESLVPLVLAAAVCGETPESLPLLDAPKERALADARDELTALGALDARGALTPRGRELYGLPLDAPLARLLVEARATGALDDVIDLVSALASGRPLFTRDAPSEFGDDLRACGCDATALVLAVRRGDPDHDNLHRGALDEARRTRARLRRGHGLDEHLYPDAPVDRERLARTALAADPRCVHVVRTRGREVAWSNGGTELSLARESAVHHARDVEALAVLDARALGEGRDATVLITCATPVPLRWIVEAGLGRDRLAGVAVERGRVVANIERVYARKVLATREDAPVGDVAREAVCALFLRGSIFRESLLRTKDRLAAATLAARLVAAGRTFDDPWRPPPLAELELEAWARARITALGVEHGDDLAMLSAADFVAPDLPDGVRESLDKEFPRTVTVGDATYEADYDLAKQSVTLRMVRGARRDPPPLGYLPRFPGLRITVEAGRSMWVVRQGG